MFDDKVEYKKHAIASLLCTVCHQFLKTMMAPPTCGCGEYKYSFKTGKYLHPTEKEVER